MQRIQTLFRSNRLRIPQHLEINQDDSYLFLMTPTFSYSDMIAFQAEIQKGIGKPFGGAVVPSLSCLDHAIVSKEREKLMGAGWSLFRIPNSSLFYVPPTPQRIKKSVGRWHSPVTSAQKSKLEVSLNDSTDILLLSDGEPLDVLDQLSPPTMTTFSGVVSSSPKKRDVFGFLGAPTPFLNGHEVTLFYGDQIVHGGTIGFEIAPQKPSTALQFDGYSPVSSALRVTAAKGNMITSLEEENPTRTLQTLEADEIYAKVVNDQGVEVIKKVIGGDTSRGIVALDSPVAVGSKIQFLTLEGAVPMDEQCRIDIDGTLIATSKLILNELVSVPCTLTIN
jgi:hypothetical protein